MTLNRRATDGTLEERVTRLEVMMEALGRQVTRELEVANGIHQSMHENVTRLTELVEKQDNRVDKIERNIAWAIGAVAVLAVLINVLAPAIQDAMGIHH